MSKTLETERLYLRPFVENDKAPFALMNQDPEVMVYFPKTLSPGESDLFAQASNRSFERYGYGLYGLELKKTGSFIGFTGLWWFKHQTPFSPAVEIGWRLARPHWGRGYAQEAARQVLLVAFNQLQLEKVVSYTSIHNQRSIKLMQTLGLHWAHNFNHPNLAQSDPLCQQVLYQTDRQEWQTNLLR